MPSRSPKMKRRILGFQRRVWWPKCTPASSSSLIPIWATAYNSLFCVWLDFRPPAISQTSRGARQGAILTGGDRGTKLVKKFTQVLPTRYVSALAGDHPSPTSGDSSVARAEPPFPYLRWLGSHLRRGGFGRAAPSCVHGRTLAAWVHHAEP